MRTRSLLLSACLIFSAAFALDAPDVQISCTIDFDSTYTQLSWSPIDGASSYHIYGRTIFEGADSLFLTTTATSAQFALPTDWGYQQPTRFGFFSVVADSTVGSQLEMTLVPAGTFTMGQSGVFLPEHQVTLTNDFWLGTKEVTNQEYLEALQWAYDNGHVTASSSTVQAHGQELLDLDATNYCEIAFNTETEVFYLVARTFSSGSWGPGEAYPEGYDPANHPAKEVSWYGSACYCDWRSLMEGLPAFYQGNWNQTAAHTPYTASGYRLPTEAEWEYAAQYSDERTYPWGETAPACDHVNHSSCVGWTSPVGSTPLGNSTLGLTDMAGNVFEWCGDWYGSYSSNTQENPIGASSGSARVVRGGFWYSHASVLRCALRGSSYPSSTDSGMGFRLCRTATSAGRK